MGPAVADARDLKVGPSKQLAFAPWPDAGARHQLDDVAPNDSLPVALVRAPMRQDAQDAFHLVIGEMRSRVFGIGRDLDLRHCVERDLLVLHRMRIHTADDPIRNVMSAATMICACQNGLSLRL